jgi:hypothetical protein
MVAQMKMQRTLFLIILLLVLSVFAGQSQAVLSPSDRDRLTLNLQILSSGWDQPAVDIVIPILCDSTHTQDDWNSFFAGYLQTHPLTDSLWRHFLSPIPVFHYCSEEAQQHLQEGLVEPMMDLIENIISSHAGHLGQALAADPEMRISLFNANDFFATVSDRWWYDLGDVSDNTRRRIYDFNVSLIKAYPAYLKKSSTINTANDPYVAALRAQIHLTLRNFLAFDETLKDDIAATLDLYGRYLEIWNDSSVLILDNNGLDESQLTVIRDILNAMPQGVHILSGITQVDNLGNVGATFMPISNYGYVNIFDLPIGASVGSEFPSDVEQKFADTYVIVVVHEINHQVDIHSISKSPRLNARRNSLIASAGCNPMNYLRSMFPECFFSRYPQEFFASISQQWFTSSQRTLELGLVRLHNGYTDPINQFLFFADVYSLEGDNTPFYELDTSGNITIQSIPLARNADGNITQLITPRGEYNFFYNASGHVDDYTFVATYIPGDLDADGDIDADDLNNVLIPAFGTCEADSGYRQAADLDKDHCITFIDYQLWYGYYVNQ